MTAIKPLVILIHFCLSLSLSSVSGSSHYSALERTGLRQRKKPETTINEKSSGIRRPQQKLECTIEVKKPTPEEIAEFQANKLDLEDMRAFATAIVPREESLKGETPSSPRTEAPSDSSPSTSAPQSDSRRNSLSSIFGLRPRTSSSDSGSNASPAPNAAARFATFLKSVHSSMRSIPNPLNAIDDLERAEQAKQAVVQENSNDSDEIDPRLLPFRPTMLENSQFSDSGSSEASTLTSSPKPGAVEQAMPVNKDEDPDFDYSFIQLVKDGVLEDEFVEIEAYKMSQIEPKQQQPAADKIEEHDDFVMVPNVLNTVLRTPANQGLFRQISTAIRIPNDSLMNKVKDLLVTVVKQIFFDEPPKARYPVRSSDYVPPPTHNLKPVEIAQILLFPVDAKLANDLIDPANPSSGNIVVSKKKAPLPALTTFAMAKIMLEAWKKAEFHQISIDLRRLPTRYYIMSLELKESRLQQDAMYAVEESYEIPAQEQVSVNARVAYVLYYVFTARQGLVDDGYFERVLFNEQTTVDDSDVEGYEWTIHPSASYAYTQGMEQIAAYFAVKYDLRLAGPMALRFYERFMMDILTMGVEDMATVYKAIEDDALAAIRNYWEEYENSLDANKLAILDIFAEHRFSPRTASVLHFTAAPGFAELDHLVQFLLLQVPAAYAKKANALLLAARIMYSLPSFMEQLKRALEPADLAHRNTPDYAQQIDALSANLFISIFQEFGPEAVFPGNEIFALTEWAKRLYPYLPIG